MSTQQQERPGREPLVRPPRLTTGEDRTASRLELFFDLAYVLVVMQLAAAFVDDLSWQGLLELTGLFVAIWLSWVGFTLYANRFDTDDVVFRLAKLAATLAVAGCAASATDAVGKYAVPFAVCFLLGRVILLLLYVRAWRHVQDARPTIRAYLVCIGAASVLWGVSLTVPGDLRYLVWALAVLVDGIGPVVATFRDDKLPLHVEHLPERFGLLVILVLGEAVGGVVRGVHDASWSSGSVLVGIAGFVVAGAMWWVYFDVGGARSADELEHASEENEGEDEEAVDERHDLYVYGHLPITFGTVLVGIGIEELALHPDEALPSPYGWLLAAGVALFLVGVSLILGGTFRSWSAVWPWPAAAVPAVLLVALLPFPSGLLLTAVFALGLVLLAARGTLASR